MIQRPSKLGAVLVVIAIGAALTLLVRALRGTGDERALPPAALVRVAWVVVSVMSLVGLAWLYGVPRQRGYDWTPYHNDAIALNECAAQLVLRGRDPYASLDLFSCYGERRIGPDRTTPLRRGLFSDVAAYPSDDQLDAAWDARRADPASNVEFVWRPSYPSLSILLIVPWVAAAWDTNAFYVVFLLAAMALIAWRARRDLRPFVITALLGSVAPIAFTVGGSADLLYALPLVVAWLWRERSWSAVAFGIAAATKQLAWFFAPYLFMQWVARHGWREALRRAAVAAAAFAVANLPLALPDPGAWLAGVVTPVAEPMFPRGAGLVFLSTNGILPLLPGLVYLGIELLVEAACLLVAWRLRRSDPEIGVVLAVVPLFFAYRSLFSYFFLLPLFAVAAVVRLRIPRLSAGGARRAGAFTVLAEPARERA